MGEKRDHAYELKIDLEAFHKTERRLVEELKKPVGERDCKAAAWWVDGLEQLMGSIRANARYIDQRQRDQIGDELHSAERTMTSLREKAKVCIKAI